MNINLEIPNDLRVDAEKYFGKITVVNANKLVALSRVSISFTKGSPDTYFIVSGIIKDDKAHEAKVVYKKRLIDSEAGPVSSNCDCHEWNEKGHCRHTAAIFISYYLHLYRTSEYTNLPPGTMSPPIALGGAYGVSVQEYGTIIAGTNQLEGAPGNATYSSLQYLLVNNKTVNFPMPENFTGKLGLDLNFESKDGESPYHFYYSPNEDALIKEISILENLYIFNWREGQCLHIPRELKDYIQKLRIRRNFLSTEDILALYFEYDIAHLCDLRVNGIPIDEVNKFTPNCRIDIAPGDRKGYLDFSIQFFNDQQMLLSPPKLISSFCFTDGLLSTFKKKKDAYDFISSLSDSIKYENDGYKKDLLSTSRRDDWNDILKSLLKSNESIRYDSSTKGLAYYDNHTLRLLISLIYDSFGETAFRFSTYHLDQKKITYEVSPSNLFDGLSDFHQKVGHYGVSIFYNRNEIAKWGSRIRFERRQSTTKWFDLELKVSKEDLEIINKADLERGLVLTDQGLVLLEKEQKDLLKFMKKYTKYEVKAGEATEGEEREGEFSEEMLAQEKDKLFLLPFNRARIFELFELKKLGIEGALTKEEEELCERLMTLENVPEYPIPKDLDEIMRPYQKDGYHWLRFLHENKLGACLADDMGLGKTLQTITFLKSVMDQVNKVLIVCPVSILINWENEFSKFSDIKPYIYHGGAREVPEGTKVILTSYGVMKREIENTFSQIDFDILVLDEVQHLKNIRSMGAYAARKIKADFRVCLTGTPVENDLAEFYNILDLSVPGVWGDLHFFRTSSTQKSRLLARKTAAPFILRRTKDQVLTDLPAKIENNVFLNLSDKEKDNYDTTLDQIKNKILNSPTKKRYGEILKGLLSLRQKCLWQDIEKSDTSSTFNDVDSTKVQFLVEQLEQIVEEGHQTIIFSQFTTYLDHIQKILRDKNWKLSRIDGSQSVKKRQEQVEVFQSGKSQIFLISLRAGGVGLNLTAASYVFIMDPWWNPAVEAQAIDRAHRIGQENTLTVYRPIIKNSVEEKVLQLQEMKKKLFLDLLPDDEDDLFTGKLSMKDFESLFD